MSALNTILLRRKQCIALTPSTHQKAAEAFEPEILATLLKSLEELGYTLSAELTQSVCLLSLQEVTTLHDFLITTLKKMVGDHKVHKPMYPNFPKDVMDRSLAELYLMARIHYLGDWIGLRLLPHSPKQERPAPTPHPRPAKVIQLANNHALINLCQQLMSIESSLSTADREDLQAFVRHHPQGVETLLNNVSYHKENTAFLAGVLWQEAPLALPDFMTKNAHIPRDLLRWAIAFSTDNIIEADTSLSTRKPRFKSFKKALRRHILARLNQILRDQPKLCLQDMSRDREFWKRAGERLHPGDYSRRYPYAYQAFVVLRSSEKMPTPNTELETYFQNGNVTGALKHLKERPGELVRRLDHLLRLNKDTQQLVLEHLESIAHRVSSKVLLQAACHFEQRPNPPALRTFFPKGNVGKLQAVDNNLPALSPALCEQVVTLCYTTLKARFAQTVKTQPNTAPAVYIDPALKKYPIPFSMRSASKALKTLARGSRLPLTHQVFGTQARLRFFIWWQDGKERTDLDLSAFILNAQHEHMQTLSYYDLKGDYGVHSGDITSAPEGASEFVDIQIQKALKAGVRYIVMVVNSYTDQAFYELPECFAGFMLRNAGAEGQGGDIYDPRTVENCYDLTGDTRISLPLIIDLQTSEIIWTDLGLTRTPSHANNVHNNMSALTLMNRAMTSLNTPNLHRLFSLHYPTNTVSDRTQADIVFTTEKHDDLKENAQVILPTDTEMILSEYL